MTRESVKKCHAAGIEARPTFSRPCLCVPSAANRESWARVSVNKCATRGEHSQSYAYAPCLCTACMNASTFSIDVSAWMMWAGAHM